MSFVLRLLVPEQKSSLSTMATFRPRDAASSATPLPVAPPPITSTSYSVVFRSSHCDQQSRKGYMAMSVLGEWVCVSAIYEGLFVGCLVGCF